MKFFRRICPMICLAAAILFFAPACGAEEAYVIADEGMDLPEISVSIHYPVISGSGDGERIRTVNELIRDRCRIGEYLTRTAKLMVSGGSLKTEWKGSILGGVFSCAVSAQGALTDARETSEWTAVTVDLQDGREVSFSELFTDEEAARKKIEEYLQETVSPELSPLLMNSDLTPLPDMFYPEPSGLTLLYPAGQLSTLSDRAGDVRIGWNELKDVLDLSEDGILNRIGAEDMITLSGKSAEKIRETAGNGQLTGIPVKIGDSMQALTDRWHMLTDPDGFEGGRLFALEGGCFRGVYLMTDDLSGGWETSKVQGIRTDEGCLWGLCPGETLRTEWIAAMGEADASVEIGDERAEANRLEPGNCDYYYCGDYLLQLYSDREGTLTSVILTE